MKDDLAGLRPTWLVRPLVWLASKMSGPLFIVQFILFLIIWMAWNTIGPTYVQFDKAPFIGLNLFMSALAGIQCSVIGVKQTISDYMRDWEYQEHERRHDALLIRIEQQEETIIDLLNQLKKTLKEGKA